MAKKHRQHSVQPPAPGPLPASPSLPDPLLNRVVIVVLFFLPFLFFVKYLFGGCMLFGTDFIGDGGYVAHQFMAEYIKTHGAVAFWQPAILCGQPTVAAFFGDLFYPTFLLRLFLPVHVVWAWTFVLHFFLAGLGTYLFLKEHKLGVIPAALGGVAYMFAGSLVTLTYAGHDGRLIGSALLPLALFFLHRGMTRRHLIFFLLCGLIVGLQLLSGHVQKVYYTGLVLVAYFVFMLVRQLRQAATGGRRLAPGPEVHAASSAPTGSSSIVHRSSLSTFLRLSGSFAIGMAFAGALAAVQYLPIYGNLPYGARGGDKGYAYASSWSMHPAETFDLLTPRFSGAVDSYSRLGQYYQQAGIPIPPRAETYWGPNSFKLHSEYLGVIPLVFAIVAVFRLWRRREVRFFFFTFAGALVMAWGGHTFLYRLPYHLFPGVAKFRGPAMIFFVAAFSLVVLAGFGLSYVLQELRTPSAGRGSLSARLRPALLAGLVPLALLLFLLAARDSAAALFCGSSPVRLAAFEANVSGATSGLIVAIVLWGVGFVLALLVGSGRLRPLAFGGVAAAVMVLDMGLSLNLWSERTGYVPGIPPPSQYFAADRVVHALETDTTLFRVLPVPRQYEHDRDGLLWLHGIHSAGGSIPNPIQTWQEFIGADSVVGFAPYNLFDSLGLRRNFLDLLNVKYVIAQGRGGPMVYPNDSALPRAFVAAGFEVMRDKDALISRLTQSDFSPGRTALLYEDPGLPRDMTELPADSDRVPSTSGDSTPDPRSPAPNPSAGTAAITLYDANRIKVHAVLPAPGILVLSENYHPDWKVLVDGRPAKMLQAYHTLRAVALGPGEHQVEFTLVPRYYRLGLFVSLGAMAFIAIVGIVTWLPRRRKPAEPQPARAAT